MDCSPPGSSVHGISLARLQDWVAISFSKGSSWPGIEPRSPMCRLSLVLQADSFWTEPCVKPPSGVRRLICGICPRSCLWGHFSEESLFFILQLKYYWYTVSSMTQSCQFFAIPWTAACHAVLSITDSCSLLKLMSMESVMPSNHLILCRPLLLLPSNLTTSGSFAMLMGQYYIIIDVPYSDS